MTAAELLGVQVLYVGGAIYLAAVFVECVLEIRRDAFSASQTCEHPNKAKHTSMEKMRQKRCNCLRRDAGVFCRVRYGLER